MSYVFLFLTVFILPLSASAFTTSDLWSSKIWDKSQEIRRKHASVSDRLTMHLWDQPDLAEKYDFFDCDIVLDDNSKTKFMFSNLYDMDEKREAELSKLPKDIHVFDTWPMQGSTARIPYRSNDLDEATLTDLRSAFRAWEKIVPVVFKAATFSDKNFLLITRGIGCYATLGYDPKLVPLMTILPGRCNAKVIMHLLGHVLGLPHPTSIVGYSHDFYLMPHHAATPAFGIFRTRIGVDVDPFDLMLLDPWFCSRDNRTTWRPRSPPLYKYASVAGAGKNPTRTSGSVILLLKAMLSKERQRKCGYAECQKRCDVGISPECHCKKVDEAHNSLKALKPSERCYEKDMNEAFIGRAEVAKNLYFFARKNTYQFCALYHTPDIPLPLSLRRDIRCWQCAIHSLRISARALFGDGKDFEGKKQVYTSKQVEQFRLIALGSRCTLFSLEVNGVLEEAWYRLCLHQLLDSGGEHRLAWRGPGTVFFRYYSSSGFREFESFNTAMLEHLIISWSIGAAEDCSCNGGPEAEIQTSAARP